MAQQVIFLGTNPNDGTGESLRGGGSKINNNFTELYALQSDTINAGAVAYNFTGATNAELVQRAIDDAVLLGKSRVYVPASLLPYDASLVTFNTAVQMVREGGDFSVYDVLAYGANGLGVTSDSPAFTPALSAAGTVAGVVSVPDPSVGYLLTQMHTVPSNTTVRGYNKRGTRIILGANVHIFDLATGSRLESLYLDGNGAAFTGHAVRVFTGQGGQTIVSCRIVDFSDYCIDFVSETAGSQFLCLESDLAQLDGTITGQEAVIIRGSATALASPRTFIGIQCQGKAFINMGPCNNLFILGCRVDGLLWSDDSRGVTISGTRIGSTLPTMTIKGQNIAISGSDIGPTTTIGAGVQHLAMRGNSYNNPPIIDAAFSATNDLETLKDIDRTVGTTFIAFANGDTTPSVGNGRDFQTANSGSTTITYFDDGVNGQRFMLRLDVNTAITHNASFIRLKAATSIGVGTVTADNLISFIRLNAVWFEEYRNF